MKRVRLPYGKGGELSVDIPARNFAGAFSSTSSTPVDDPRAQLAPALQNPIGTPSLYELAKKSSKVLLIVDDNTRRTPVRLLLPSICKILAEAGIADENVKILFASGTHREMTREEKIEKIGEEALERYACISHDYEGAHISLGETKFGTPVEVNPLVKWADLSVAIGSILPHAFCGWSGGGKMILPGVCSARSILATHMLPFKDPGIGLGVTLNQARTEIDEAARMAGLGFIVNTILDADGEIVDLVAGDAIAAHRAGIARARAAMGVEIPAADLVIASAWPEDENYWQAGKSIYPMERVVRPGGLALLVARLAEGRGEHPGLFDAMGEGESVLLERLESVKNTDIDEALAIAAALSDRRILKKARFGLVSDGLPMSETANGAVMRFATPNDAVQKILGENPDARIVCLLNAPEILPIEISPIR